MSPTSQTTFEALSAIAKEKGCVSVMHLLFRYSPEEISPLLRARLGLVEPIPWSRQRGEESAS